MSSLTMLFQAEKFELDNRVRNHWNDSLKKLMWSKQYIMSSKVMASLNTVRAHFIFSWKLLWLYRT